MRVVLSTNSIPTVDTALVTGLFLFDSRCSLPQTVIGVELAHGMEPIWNPSSRLIKSKTQPIKFWNNFRNNYLGFHNYTHSASTKYITESTSTTFLKYFWVTNYQRLRV